MSLGTHYYHSAPDAEDTGPDAGVASDQSPSQYAATAALARAVVSVSVPADEDTISSARSEVLRCMPVDDR